MTPEDETFLEVHLRFYADKLGRFEDAESRLLEVYTISVEQFGKEHQQSEKTIRKLADHYESWRRAAPGADHDIATKRWRAKHGVHR